MNTGNAKPYSEEEVLKGNSMLEKETFAYDPDFWENYTIMVPTEDFNKIAKDIEERNHALVE